MEIDVLFFGVHHSGKTRTIKTKQGFLKDYRVLKTIVDAKNPIKLKISINSESMTWKVSKKTKIYHITLSKKNSDLAEVVLFSLSLQLTTLYCLLSMRIGLSIF